MRGLSTLFYFYPQLKLLFFRNICKYSQLLVDCGYFYQRCGRLFIHVFYCLKHLENVCKKGGITNSLNVYNFLSTPFEGYLQVVRVLIHQLTHCLYSYPHYYSHFFRNF